MYSRYLFSILCTHVSLLWLLRFIVRDFHVSRRYRRFLTAHCIIRGLSNSNPRRWMSSRKLDRIRVRTDTTYPLYYILYYIICKGIVSSNPFQYVSSSAESNFFIYIIRPETLYYIICLRAIWERKTIMCFRSFAVGVNTSKNKREKNTRLEKGFPEREGWIERERVCVCAREREWVREWQRDVISE